MAYTTRHPDYLAYEPTWDAIEDAYQGSGAVKAAVNARWLPRGVPRSFGSARSYLPRPNGMTGASGDDLYAAYVSRTAWFGATERAVHGLTGAVFRKEPVIEVPPLMEPQLDDITLTGVPLRSFAEETVRETIKLGRFGILIDFPVGRRRSDGTREPPPPGSRPYWVAYRAKEITNWRTLQLQGDTIVSMVELKESVPVPQGPWGTDDYFVVKDRTQYRVLRLDEQGRYEVSLWEDVPENTLPGPQRVMVDAWVPTAYGQPLTFIPFQFFGPFSLEPQVEKSLIEALVEINYRHYRHSADYEHALHLIALPTLYICTDADLPPDLLFGSATALHIRDSQAKVGLAALDAAGLPAQQIALDNDKKDMAALGARLLESAPSVQETATANMNRLLGAESPIVSLVKTTSQGLTQALRIHAWWAGLVSTPNDANVHMALNADLVAQRMEPQMLLALMQALLNDTISFETFYFNLQQGEIARPMVDVDEEKDLIDLAKEQRPLVTPVLAPGTPVATNGAARTGR